MLCVCLLVLSVPSQIILHQEHEKEKERELILSVIDDGEERNRVDKLFGLERANARRAIKRLSRCVSFRRSASSSSVLCVVVSAEESPEEGASADLARALLWCPQDAREGAQGRRGPVRGGRYDAAAVRRHGRGAAGASRPVGDPCVEPTVD